MTRVTAWTVLVLGGLFLVGGIFGAVVAVREGEDSTSPLLHALLLIVVVVGMLRAARKLREPSDAR